MKTNVELEFINKVLELSEKMQELADFWLENEKELEDANVSKSYPFSLPLEDLAFDAHDWFLALVNNYIKKDPKNLYTIFNEYYKSMQK